MTLDINRAWDNEFDSYPILLTQFEGLYQGRSIWSGDKIEDRYFILPSISGLVVRVYPNVLTDGNPVMAMAVSEGELERRLTWRRDRRTGQYQFDDLRPLVRDQAGRFYLDIPLGQVGTGIHALRFYALVEDARTRITTLNLLLFKVRWGGGNPESSLADVFRFRTEAWPQGYPAPSAEYLVNLLRRAGTGGSGMVFASLLAEDARNKSSYMTEASSSQTTKHYEDWQRTVTESINVLAKNQEKIGEQVNKNTQAVADLDVRVENLEDWALSCSNSGRDHSRPLPEKGQPDHQKMVQFRVAYVNPHCQEVRIVDNTRGLPLMPVEVRIPNGTAYLPGGVAEYMLKGIKEGTKVTLNFRQIGGRWRTITFSITSALQNRVLVVPVER